MSFLSELSSALLQQVGLAENVPGNLDFKGKPYGKLGDFASKIDTTAHRQYAETGIVRNIRPRAVEILMQEPDITVVVKKRVFGSLIENYRTDLMDDDEKLFLRATKKLFYNKCREIAAYERLTKFERIISKNDGIISDYALPFIFDAFDTLVNSPVGNFIDNNVRSTIELIRKVKKFSDPQYFTTWNIASDLPFASGTGEGTGTFDLTLVHQISAKNSVELGGGSASLTIEDPYKLMIVTGEDIERAISDATNLFKQNSFFTLTQSQLDKVVHDLKEELNSVRLSRGASRIFFKIQEETILFKKVRAIIDEEGREIKFNFDAGILGSNLFSPNDDSVIIDPISLEGINGLQGIEASLFKQIINNIYLLMGLHQTTRSENKEYNKATSYIRRKMDLHYRNKPIIQPMDSVYIFISSKTLSDAKVVQGLKYNFVNDSLLNKINDTVTNIESTLDNIKATFGGSSGGQSFIEQERNAIAGPDFPLWLYNLLRNDFTRQSAGTCVFAGVVDQPSHSYSAANGKYILNISIRDNTQYFKMGYTNINPSVEVYNSSLYDPLTPFKVDFDEASGLLRGEIPPLLDANVRLLNSRSVRAKLGRFRGSAIDQSIFLLPEFEQINAARGTIASRQFGRSFRNKLIEPDGFVYRWKEGIGTLVMFGEPHSDFDFTLGSFKSERSPNITQNPFAGQDVMNILSLLVTGQPYSYNNFVRGAIEWGKLHKDDLSNKDLSDSFFKSLIRDVTKHNAIWGNFIPFKKLVVNERGYDFLARGEFDLIIQNEKLSQLLRQRAETFDEIASLASQFASTPQFYKTDIDGLTSAIDDPANISTINSLTSKLQMLDEQIREYRQAFNESIRNTNLQTEEGTLGIFGDDISFDSTITGSDPDTNESKKRENRKELRDKLNYLTSRRVWKVRANEDPNLFVVDDTYDKNYDVQVFEVALASKLELFNSTYSSIFDQINNVIRLLGIEVFADSQGHIQARPPQYNRMPSSVYRNLLQKRAETGVQIFPSFLERLFFTSIQGLTDHIEIVEDQIRLRGAALGKITDQQVNELLRSSDVASGKGGIFEFLTERATGSFTVDIRKVLDQDQPDLQEERASGALKNLSDILKGPLNATVNFSIAKRAEVINDARSFKGNTTANDEVKKIAERLEEKTRQTQPSTVQAVLSNDRYKTATGIKQTDILRITNEIGSFISERQRLLKRLSHTLKNLRAGLSINAENSSSSNSLLFPTLNREAVEIPEIIEHMIENENTDDLGVGSGKRFVIQDSQIKNLEIVENHPEYNMVQVDGRLNSGLVSLPTGLNVENGGNAIGTAWAVDYDLWRMYGLKTTNSKPAPFFSDPNTQCAPYAVFLLNLQRRNIFRGNITVVGNEFIQAGEVYYIEDRDLLFYADSVTHSFTYNGSYDTSMSLTFGHNPGEYIPTQLDIIGKGLYSNRYQAELVRHVRHGRVDNSTHLATLIYDNKQSTFSSAKSIDALVGGEFGEQNRKNLGNLMLVTTGLLTPTRFGQVLNVEIRVYQNSDPQVNLGASNSDLRRVASSVRDWMIDPSQKSIFEGQSLLPANESGPVISKDRIKLEIVDLNPSLEDETRSPSSAAWSAARTIAANSNISFNPGFPITTQQESSGITGSSIDEGSVQNNANNALLDIERRALVGSIIDIWVTFTESNQVLEGSKKQGSATSQAEQQAKEALD